MDAAGRLVIPREVRRVAGLKPGVPLEVRWRDGRIEIEVAPLPVRLEQRGRWVVAVPDGADELPPLSNDVVEQTRRELQDERGVAE
jgi:AbrB family looped-hinge helix DNA binding protein